MQVATTSRVSATTVLRVCAWGCVAVLAFLTFTPVQFRPATFFPRSVEHLLAFGIVGAAFALAYPQRRIALVAGSLVLLPLLEIMQNLVPGRHAQTVHAVMNIAGVWSGVGLVALLQLWLKRS
jgi:VanZ family protein